MADGLARSNARGGATRDRTDSPDSPATVANCKPVADCRPAVGARHGPTVAAGCRPVADSGRRDAPAGRAFAGRGASPAWRARRLAVLLALAALVAWAAPAAALVTHDDTAPADRPADEVVGPWRSNASYVAVAPDWIATTRHQGGNGVGATFDIGGVTYTGTAEHVGGGANADLRLVKLTGPDGQPARLESFAPAYTAGDESSKPVVLGGYGQHRGEEIKSGLRTVGYDWTGSANDTLRWGTNWVDGAGFADTSSYDSHVLEADFDGPLALDTTDHEATMAYWDSGGGWFIQDGAGVWRVAGLSRGVQRAGESYFSPADDIDAVRISQYAGWMNGIIGQLSWPGDANLDLKVDDADFAILKANYGLAGVGWAGGDFNLDGEVSLGDLGMLAANYGWVSPALGPAASAAGTAVPEPATTALLLAGGVTVLRRRRPS